MPGFSQPPGYRTVITLPLASFATLPLAAGVVPSVLSLAACGGVTWVAWKLRKLEAGLNRSGETAPAPAVEPVLGPPSPPPEVDTPGLWAERAQLEKTLDHAGVGIYQLDADRRFTKVNRRLLQTLGYESEETLLTQAPVDVLPWLCGTENEGVCREALASGTELYDLESCVVHAGGEAVWLLESLVPVRDESGEIASWLGTVHDVTKQTEAMIAEVEFAKARSDAKGAFLANMSHEIRTPLNGIIGMLDLLQASELGTTETHYTDVARSSADALLCLINDILDFSKIEAGHIELEHIPFKLRDVIESTSEQFAVQAHMKGLELNCDLPPSLPHTVCGDAERLRQVIANLLGNAVKFTPEGEINLRVVAVDESVVRFTVEDTGIGMTDAQSAEIFEAFAQGDASTTRRFGGTGLGLSISQQLVGLMGGTIAVSSKEGRGSTFTFELPLAPHSEESALPDGGEASIEQIRGKRVLIVDDNATNCEILQTQLRAWGFQADICRDSEFAVEQLHLADGYGKPYSLMLLDMCMPVMDGKDVAMAIRRQQTYADLPIILLSSNHAMVSDEERATYGIDAAMTKPVRQSRLYDSIVQVLCGQRRSDVPTTAEPTAAKPALAASTPSAPPRVLVVEDNEINQVVVRKMLATMGYPSDLAEHGGEAVEQVQRVAYDLVLMDGHMPVMDGLKATTAIRDLERDGRVAGRTPGGDRLPIVALTANVVAGARESFEKAGVDDFLTKPVTLRCLREAFDSLVTPAAAPAAPVAAPVAPAPAAAPAPVAAPAETTRPLIADHVPVTPVVRDAAGETVFDRDEFATRCGGDDELQRQVLQLVRESLPAMTSDVVAAHQSGDLKELASTAHRLKGATGDCSLLVLSKTAGEIEHAAAAGTPVAADAVGQIARRVDDTLALLDDLINQAN